MTKQSKPDEQGDALTPGAIATMRELLGWSEQQIEAARIDAERQRAAGGFTNWVAMCEAARIASEARGYTVQPDEFTAKECSTSELINGLAGKPIRASIVGWAHYFALELAVLNDKEKADRMHVHRFEQAMLHAARKGDLSMCTFDIVGAPVEVTADMTDDVITQRLGVDTGAVRAWATVHWPELMQSRLLAAPAGQAAAPVGDTCIEGEDAADFIECANNEGEPIDWRFWVRNMPELTTAQAARLMAALNPQLHHDLHLKRNERAGAAKRRAQELEILAAAHRMESASPRDWLAWADGLGEAVHVGFRLAVMELTQPETAPAGQAATIAEGPTLPEQWKAAAGNRQRRAEIAVMAKQRCGGVVAEAARLLGLGTSTATLYRALKYAEQMKKQSVGHSVAGVVPMYAQLARKAHET
ncbi:hypothetical protein GALL_231860 [mine drainage metagenome]|uniref:Uncharacterized protein n=1 Tax=mine drainage metagenome TaxID=410659 RepID=A0A1J5RS71_9ZZZZ